MSFKVALGALAGLVVIGAFYWLNSGPVEVPSTTRVHHDDFAFTVENVARRPSKAETSPSIAVSLRVENDAKRVPYEWQPSTAFLIDSAGRRYAADAATSTPARSIAAGDSASVQLVYRVPADARDLHLAFWDEVFMGDVFDGLRYARLRIRLEPPQSG